MCVYDRITESGFVCGFVPPGVQRFLTVCWHCLPTTITHTNANTQTVYLICQPFCPPTTHTHTHFHDMFSSLVWEVNLQFKSSYAEVIWLCFKNYSGYHKRAFPNVICTNFTFCYLLCVSVSIITIFSVDLENTASTLISPAFWFIFLKNYLKITLLSVCKVNKETLM